MFLPPKSLQKHADLVLALGVGLAYAWSTLTTHRILPDGTFLPNAGAFSIAAFFLAIWYACRKVQQIGLDAWTWFLLAALVMVQPWLHPVLYQDALVYPAASLLLCALLAMAVGNIGNKQRAMRLCFAILLAVGAASTLLQWMQWMLPDGTFPSWLVYPLRKGYQAYGNVGQRNEAAFISALSANVAFYMARQRTLRTVDAITSPHAWLRALLWPGLLIFWLGTGVALSGSRGGIVLLFLCGLMNAAIAWKIQLRTLQVRVVLLLSVLMSLGYLTGFFLFNTFADLHQAVNALEYFHTARNYLRWALLQQATSMFVQHPLFGAGWGSFAAYGLAEAENLLWFAFSDNSHFFMSMIAAELGLVGLLCLLPVGLVIWRSFQGAKSSEQSTVWGIAILCLAYSCYDFPLWYVGYLLIFTAMLAFLDIPWKKISSMYGLGFAVLAFALFVAGVWQYRTFMDASAVGRVVFMDQAKMAEKWQAVQGTKMAYGQSKFQELYIFLLIPLSQENIAQKIALGKRVTSTFVDSELLTRQATLLALDKKQTESMAMFKAACLLADEVDCANVKNKTKYLAQAYPPVFGFLKNAW